MRAVAALRLRPCLWIAAGLPLLLLGCGCAPHKTREVVLYTSVDRPFAVPVVERFERETGIKVRLLTDLEAAKTAGLVNRLIGEKRRPQCDVFWNSEIGRTLMLKEKGVLAPYSSPAASDIPAALRDPDGYWVGFAARCRVIIYNKEMVMAEAAPRHVEDLTDPKWKGKSAIADPQFGTTATHVAALFALWGKDRAEAFFKGLADNRAMVVAGNAVVRDMVADGRAAVGLTDTDDAYGAIEDGKPVGVIFPDQDGQGALVIPNTVSLIGGCPHPEAGRRLVDFLLSREVEEMLALSRSRQMPVRAGLQWPKGIPTNLRLWRPDCREVARHLQEAQRLAREILVR